MDMNKDPSSGPEMSHADVPPGENFQAFRRNTADRVEEVTVRGRRRTERMLGDAGRQLEGRTHLVATMREQPLAALAIAIGAGFLLAGSGNGERRSPRISQTTNQLKEAVMGALSSAASREIRRFVDELGGSSAIGHLRG